MDEFGKKLHSNRKIARGKVECYLNCCKYTKLHSGPCGLITSQSGILVLPCGSAHYIDHTHQQMVPTLPFLLVLMQLSHGQKFLVDEVMLCGGVCVVEHFYWTVSSVTVIWLFTQCSHSLVLGVIWWYTLGSHPSNLKVKGEKFGQGEDVVMILFQYVVHHIIGHVVPCKKSCKKRQDSARNG